jgi:hypothetical protein
MFHFQHFSSLLSVSTSNRQRIVAVSSVAAALV